MHILNIYKKISRSLPFGYALPPLFINFQITSRCNLNCIMCASNQGKEYLDFASIKKIIDKLYEFYKWFIFKPKIMFSGGEPTIHKDFCNIVEYTRSRGFGVSLCTNGTLLDESSMMFLCRQNLEEIIFSIDGLEEDHDRIRGQGSFVKAFNNLKKLCLLDSKNMVVKRINTVLMKTNYDLEEFIRFFLDLPVEHLFSPVLMQGSNDDLLSKLSLEMHEFGEIKNKIYLLAKKYKRKIMLKTSKRFDQKDQSGIDVNFCEAIDWMLFIRCDGLATHCNIGPLSPFAQAKAYIDFSRKSIFCEYNSKIFRALRRQIRKTKYLNNCTECCRLSKNTIF